MYGKASRAPGKNLFPTFIFTNDTFAKLLADSAVIAVLHTNLLVT